MSATARVKKAETNHIDRDISSASPIDIASCRPTSSISKSVSEASETVIDSESKTIINSCHDKHINSSEITSMEKLNFFENKNECSNEVGLMQSACCGSPKPKPPDECRVNGASDSSCSVPIGENGLSKHIACEFGGAKPKTANNIKNIETEVPLYDCNCENRENSCDNKDGTQIKHSSENLSACSDKDQCLDDLLVQLENTTLKSGNQSVLSNVINGIDYCVYESEKQMPDIMRLITKDLSEPYSIYTYRYFIHNWPKLCFLAKADGEYVGAIVCKLDVHKKLRRRGYIAMLAVDSRYRRRAIGSTLVTKAIQAMIRDDCDEVVLETEISNMGALHLYQNLGFVRDKRLFRYYLNGVDALRLKLWLR